MNSFATGAIAAAIIGFAGYRAHALTRSGAIAAFAVGTVTYGIGGIAFSWVLLFFFASSIVLGRIGRVRKKSLTDIGKTGARDMWQVLANGGVATICLIFSALPITGHTDYWLLAFCGAYAAATADTWGTEIGTLARQLPRSILTFKPIATGLSGGITPAGTLAEVAGAMAVAIVAVLAFAGTFAGLGIRLTPQRIAGAVLAAGVAGAFVDSLLGATLQELRACPACDRTCETDPHACGAPTRLVRGMRGFSNDFVNFFATLAGAGTAFIIAAV